MPTQQELSKPDMTAACGFLLSGLPGHALFASELTSRANPFPCKPCHRVELAPACHKGKASLVWLTCSHESRKRERPKKQRCSKNDGEISCIAYRCNNPQLRQRTFGKKPPLCLSDMARHQTETKGEKKTQLNKVAKETHGKVNHQTRNAEKNYTKS